MNNSEESILKLIGELSHKNEDVRWAAAYALAKIGEPAVGPLTRALDNKDSVVRLRAAWALGRIGDLRPVDRLILTLRDGDWAVRVQVADALGNLRAARALNPLLLALRDENADVRRHVIGALGRIADPASADRIGETLKDPDWQVRMGAALVLSSIGDEKSRQFLKTAACDENEFVQKIARTVLQEKEGENCMTRTGIGKLQDFPAGLMKPVSVSGKEFLIVNVGGNLVALTDKCTHQGCRLSKGVLSGETVRCPCHGSVFNVKTGEVIKGPAREPEKTYRITLENGEIMLET